MHILQLLVLVQVMSMMVCMTILVYLKTSNTGHDSSVGSMSALYARGPEIDPCVRQILSWKLFSLSLIQEEQVISYWHKNVHYILVNCFWGGGACPGTVWLSTGNWPTRHELSC